MSGLLVALLAQIILGSADAFDKALLKIRVFDPFAYTFGVALLGAVALVLAPFGFLLSAKAALVAILSGAVWIIALFFLFTALARSEASAVLPLIGVLSPLSTLLFASFFLDASLGRHELVGFGILLAGGGVLLSVEQRGLRTATAVCAFAAAFFFGIGNVLAKEAFILADFIPAFIWIKLGGLSVAIGLLLFVPSMRARLKASWKATSFGKSFFYIANRGLAAFGSLLLLYAIFLSHPALVDATQSMRYGIIFLAGWLFLGERFGGRIFWRKLFALVIIISGFLWLGAKTYAQAFPPVSEARPIRWGVTFSAKFARQLGLDPHTVYRAMLDELAPKRIRLVAYWDDLERKRGVRDSSDLDWQIQAASDRNVAVILALGMKVPRWPECHLPDWARTLPTEEREEALRAFMKETVERYRHDSAITMWQVENEPFLSFGECPKRGENFLEKEIAIIKDFDPARPVLVTDGGEMGIWPRTARYGDVFGISLYRKVYPRFFGPITGVMEYPVTPNFFRIKERLTRRTLEDPQKPFMVIELQGEVWGPEAIPKFSLEEQMAIFNPVYFKETIAYAKATDFEDYYLWGAEWWYWLRARHHENQFWDIAKKTLAE